MTTKNVYRPEISSRSSEYIAWGLALATLFAVIVLGRNQEIPAWAWFLLVMFVFSGAVISLGNWVDRKTLLEFDEEGVHFANGLRDVTMKWQEIEHVWEGKGRVGMMVQVLSQTGHFSFILPSEMKFQGEVKSKIGFSEGVEIRDQIIKLAGLNETKDHNKGILYSRVPMN